MQSAEIIIIGGGLIGLATAYQLAQQGRQILLIEKEAEIGTQLSNRSGIMHRAVHVRPNSAAAQYLRSGHPLLRAFCEQASIPLRTGDQLFLATDERDLPNLEQLKQQALANGVRWRNISADEIPTIEPFASGIAGLLIEDVPIVDFQQVAQSLALHIEMLGGQIITHEAVLGLSGRTNGVIVKTQQETYVARYAINAAGTHADQLARQAGHQSNFTFVPFRGEYMRLASPAGNDCHHLIFPIPRLDMPFLGIHLARLDDSIVLCGSNAILAGGRQQRRKGQISLRTSVSNLFSSPIRKLSRRYFQTALWEQRRSWNKNLFALTLQRLVPSITRQRLTRIQGGTQNFAITEDGVFINDFVIESAERIIHILSTPNFGASACLGIGQAIANALSPMHLPEFSSKSDE